MFCPNRKAISKVFSMILVLLLVISLSTTANSLQPAYSEQYRAGIFYKRLCNVELTGDARTDIVNVAMSQIGYIEGNNSSQLSGCVVGNKNYTEYGLWYDGIYGPDGFQKGAWCAMFISWCAEQAKIDKSIFKQHALTTSGLNWYTNRDLTYTRAEIEKGVYTPQPGDVVYFLSPGVNRKANHVGIVLKYEDGILYAIEGNTNSGDRSTDGGQVCLKSYEITDTFIRYICTPQYK